MSLIDVEFKSQNVRRQLNRLSSNNTKISCLSDFLMLIINEGESQLYVSYLFEFEPDLRNLILNNDFNYTSTEEIEKVINIVERLKSFQIFMNKKESFDELLLVLKKRKERILSYVGEITDDTGNTVLPPRDESFSDSLNIVMIETEEDCFIEQPTGQIQKLKLDSSIKSTNGSDDRIEFNNLIDLNDTEINEQLNEAVITAKSKCTKEGIKTKRYNFNFYFDRRNCVYTGKSLGIGALSLAYNSILLNELHKIYYKFKDDVVFTAEVDKDGCLQKLNDKCLKIKLKTVFFSPYKKFVIPEDNIVEAKRELANLNDKYPKRKLELIPINNFTGIFKNLDIVEVCRLNLRQKVKANYKKYSIIANLTLSILSLLIILFFISNYLIPHLDRNPTTVSTENNRYVAFNKYSIKVWESNEENNLLSLKDKSFLDSRCLVIDLESDGINEIIYLVRTPSDKIKNRTIYCYNSDRLKWEYKVPEHKLNYNDRLIEDNFFTQGIYVLDTDNDGYKEVICTGMQNTSYPFTIMKLSHEGKLISEYWNSGYLDVIEFYDIDRDGKNELVAGDCNDEFNQAAIAVFNPVNIKGSSPQTDPLGNGKKGTEKYYVIFPKSFLCTLLNQKINNIRQLLQPRSEGLDVYVYEGFKVPQQPGGFIIYRFNKSMEVIDVEFSTPYIGTYNNFVKHRKIKPVKNLTFYAEELKKQVKYWDGEKFVNYPTINNNYLNAKASSGKVER